MEAFAIIGIGFCAVVFMFAFAVLCLAISSPFVKLTPDENRELMRDFADFMERK